MVGRQGPQGRTHLMSPAMAAAAAVTGRLCDVRELLGTLGEANVTVKVNTRDPKEFLGNDRLMFALIPVTAIFWIFK